MNPGLALAQLPMPVVGIERVGEAPWSETSVSEWVRQELDDQLVNDTVAASGVGLRELRCLIDTELPSMDLVLTLRTRIKVFVELKRPTSRPYDLRRVDEGDFTEATSWSRPMLFVSCPYAPTPPDTSTATVAPTFFEVGAGEVVTTLWRALQRLAALNQNDPQRRVTQFLLRLIRLGRRADAFRQLVMQRVRTASRSVMQSADRPPGEVVVSSARVPRGPDLSRVTSVVSVVVARRRQSALT